MLLGASLSLSVISHPMDSPLDLGLTEYGSISSSIAVGSQEVCSGLAQCYFCCILLVKAVVGLIQIKGVGEIGSTFWWRKAKSPCRRTCVMGITAIANLENIICHKPYRTSWRYEEKNTFPPSLNKFSSHSFIITCTSYKWPSHTPCFQGATF